MAAALDREQHAVLAREPDRLDHVGRAGRSHDRRGMAVDHAVPQGARHVVALIGRQQQAAAQRRSQRDRRDRDRSRRFRLARYES
jgi:hypothetical protein